ncbi:AGAP011311-PA, partial [Anopheles gambiae str. PEST]
PYTHAQAFTVLNDNPLVSLVGGGAAALGATVGLFPPVFFFRDTVKPGGGCVALHTVSIRTAHGGTLGTRVRLCRQTMA